MTGDFLLTRTVASLYNLMITGKNSLSTKGLLTIFVNSGKLLPIRNTLMNVFWMCDFNTVEVLSSKNQKIFRKRQISL